VTDLESGNTGQTMSTREYPATSKALGSFKEPMSDTQIRIPLGDRSESKNSLSSDKKFKKRSAKVIHENSQSSSIKKSKRSQIKDTTSDIDSEDMSEDEDDEEEFEEEYKGMHICCYF